MGNSFDVRRIKRVFTQRGCAWVVLLTALLMSQGCKSSSHSFIITASPGQPIQLHPAVYKDYTFATSPFPVTSKAITIVGPLDGSLHPTTLRWRANESDYQATIDWNGVPGSGNQFLIVFAGPDQFYITRRKLRAPLPVNGSVALEIAREDGTLLFADGFDEAVSELQTTGRHPTSSPATSSSKTTEASRSPATQGDRSKMADPFDSTRISDIRLTKGLNAAKGGELDEKKFRELIASAQWVPEADLNEDWAYAPWYSGDFEFAGDRLSFELFLGGRGKVVYPDGTERLFFFSTSD